MKLETSCKIKRHVIFDHAFYMKIKHDGSVTQKINGEQVKLCVKKVWVDLVVQGQYIFISEYIPVACTVQTHQGSTLLQGQHVSGGLSDPWFLVCVPSCLFLSLLLVLLVIVRIVEKCWIC